MIARFLRYLLSILERKTMSIDPTTGLEVPDAPVDAASVAPAAEPVAETPAVEPAPVVPPRPLEAIKADVDAAKAAHVAAVANVKDTHGILSGLSAEYHAAVAYFAADASAVEADIKAVLAEAESLFSKAKAEVEAAL